MTVRTLTLALTAAIALGTQGIAQQGDSLERALADLNSGVLVAPGGATANGSTGADFSGDARVCNNAMGDNSVDVRARLNAAFDVNEGASAFIQFTSNESWGAGDTTDALGNGIIEGANAGDISQAWFSANDLFGDGGSAKIGHSYVTLGSGNILGTDEWDARPSGYTGLWYGNSFGGFDLSIGMYDDLAVGSFYTVSTSIGLGDNGFLNGLDVDYITRGDTDTYSLSSGGDIAMINWSGEYASNDDATGYAIDLNIGLGDMSGGMISGLTVSLTDCDAAGLEIDAADHGAFGISDTLGGTYSEEVSSTTVSVGLNLMEGWDTTVSFITAESASLGDHSETNLEISRGLGSGVNGYLGYGTGDTTLLGVATDVEVLYLQLGLSF